MKGSTAPCPPCHCRLVMHIFWVDMNEAVGRHIPGRADGVTALISTPGKASSGAV